MCLPFFTANAGATSLIAVIGSDRIKDLGWLYLAVPVLSASVLFVLMAVVLNNMVGDRSYPTGWLGRAPVKPVTAEDNQDFLIVDSYAVTTV